MATNLVSEIAEVLSPNIVSSIASALGLNRTATQKAVVAAVPALLAALMNYVTKAQGATKLAEVVRKQEPGMLSSLASVIGEPGQKALIDQGASVLTSLLGGKSLSALTGAVGQYADVGKEGSKSLLGLLGPVVLGVLARGGIVCGRPAPNSAGNLTNPASDVLSRTRREAVSNALAPRQQLRDLSSLRRLALPRSQEPAAPCSPITRDNRSNTHRWATNAGSRTARRHGEARKADGRNTDGHGHARISAHDAFVRHNHGRQRASQTSAC